jgi:5-methyltetrahydropteroyltriglutamate--homocysteine methyltransferase
MSLSATLTRVDHIGSLLRPSRLLEYKRSGEVEAKALRKIEDSCIREVVTLQEDAGLDIITDGEFRRESWRSGFAKNVGGIEDRAAQAEVNRRGYVDMGSFIIDAAPFVCGKIKRHGGIATAGFAFLRGITTRVAKVTLPSPSFMHFFAGEGAVDTSVYPTRDAFCADLVQVYIAEIAELARLGAHYVQLDEAPLGFLCDEGIRSRLERGGISRDDWADLYVEMINAIVRAAPSTVTVAVHICRGNSMGKSGGRGSFEAIAERLFPKIEATRLLLEFDEPHNSDLRPLRFVRDDATVVMGFVSTKTQQVEDAAWLLSRIHDAQKYLPLERMWISPQCGFSSRELGTSLTFDHQIAKLRLLVTVAQQAWHENRNIRTVGTDEPKMSDTSGHMDGGVHAQA